MGLTVAVTGPTGELGISVVEALEREPSVAAVRTMARRPFDPAARGWRKTTYRRGAILDPRAVADLVDDADVVIHLAYVVIGSHRASSRVNVAGCRRVFETTVRAGRPRRLVYTSSVAAYGYHRDHPQPITEDVPLRGSPEHYYSIQKADCERVLAEVTADSPLDSYMLRPCIVAGPRATNIVRYLPWRHLPGGVVRAWHAVPGHGLVRPPLPSPGLRLQLVHHDDVAAAILAATLGDGPPGAYNIAGSGTISAADYAWAVGALPVPVPHTAVTLGSLALATLPVVPAWAEWLHTLRAPMIMSTERAHRDLGWTPRYSAAQTLAATVAATVAGAASAATV
jgi:nucleoside-diphosphate-sugar epimerase